MKRIVIAGAAGSHVHEVVSALKRPMKGRGSVYPLAQTVFNAFYGHRMLAKGSIEGPIILAYCQAEENFLKSQMLIENLATELAHRKGHKVVVFEMGAYSLAALSHPLKTQPRPQLGAFVSTWLRGKMPRALDRYDLVIMLESLVERDYEAYEAKYKKAVERHEVFGPVNVLDPDLARNQAEQLRAFWHEWAAKETNEKVGGRHVTSIPYQTPTETVNAVLAYINSEV